MIGPYGPCIRVMCRGFGHGVTALVVEVRDPLGWRELSRHSGDNEEQEAHDAAVAARVKLLEGEEP